MIAGLTVDSGAGALLFWLAVAVVLVPIGAVIVDGWIAKRQERRDGLAALGRACTRGRR